jgi:RNA polymerase sigma-70 factor (ECF subfamily)
MRRTREPGATVAAFSNLCATAPDVQGVPSAAPSSFCPIPRKIPRLQADTFGGEEPTTGAPDIEGTHVAGLLTNEEFAVLYTRSHLDLLRFVLTLVPNRSEAEDVVQETARRLWQKIDDYDPALPFWPWARKFAYYEVLKHRKARALESQFFSDELVERLADERDMHAKVLEERRQALTDCLARLEATARRLVLDRYGGELSVGEIAQRERKSANAISLMLHRIRQKLLECINGWHYVKEALS